MLTLAFAILLILNAVAAGLSGSKGLLRLSALLIASFVICELVVVLMFRTPVRPFFEAWPHLRVAVFAAIDFIVMVTAFWIIHQTPEMPSLFKQVFRLAYIGMICAHGTILTFGAPTFYGYDEMLNVLTFIAIASCAASAITIVFLPKKDQSA